MSNYSRVTRNPLTGKFERADWIDNKFGRHAYGVYFPKTGTWHQESERCWEFDSDTPDAPLSGKAT